MSQKLNAAQLTNFPKSTKATLLTGTPNQEAVTPQSIYDASASLTIPWQPTITLVLTTALNHDFVISGTTVLANATGLIPGQSGRIRITQDSSGSRTMSYGSYWKFPNGAPTLSTAANAVDAIAYFVHSTTVIEATLIKAFS